MPTQNPTNRQFAPHSSWSLVLVVMAFLASACATRSTTQLGWANEDSSATQGVDSAAFHADSFTYRKPMPIRPANDFNFYFKNCSLSDDQSFYSKTSYWCSEP